jgi:hypothetical protein
VILTFSISPGWTMKSLQHYNGTLADRENEICGYWQRSLNEQAAIRTGKLRIIPGTESRDPDFKQYSMSDLDAAQVIFGGMRGQFNDSGRLMGERFCGNAS